LSADVELLFERIDNRWSEVERLLAEMLQRRGHWLRYVMGQGDFSLSERVSESLRDIAADHLERACSVIGPELRNTLSVLPGVGPLGPQLECLKGWRRLADLTLTGRNGRKGQGSWRKQVTRTLDPAFESSAARQQLLACISLVSGVPGAREVLSALAALPAVPLSAADTRAIEALARVLRTAAAELQLEFASAGRVDYTYVSGAAREALVEDGLPTDLALRAGLSLKHVLVDEFQDTSLDQFDLLEALTAGWEPGDGRTVFAVGDPMQSIYQFRDAEVGLFLRARERGLGGLRLEPLQLTRNFRSAPRLVEWTNTCFAKLFPERDDERASAVAFTPSLAARGSDGAACVECRLFAEDDRAAEATFIAESVLRLRQEEPDATIAVLVAARTHAALIMAALESAAIPAIGVDLVPLGEVPIVRDLVALLRALCHPGDRAAWLAVLRAPWCGLSLASLTVLSQRKDPLLLPEALSDEERLARCSDADRVRLARVRQVLEQAIEARDLMPIAEWLETTWLRLGGADAYDADQLPHARAFFTALSESGASGEWRGLRDLDALTAELYAEPRATGANPVQIMTIHRAKGLEFDHVFLPSLDRLLNRDRDSLLQWLDLPRREEGSDLLIAPVPAVGDTESGDLNRYLRRVASERVANERLRLLYVAATRARRSLRLSAAPETKPDGTIAPRTGTLLAALWPAISEEFLASREAEPARSPVSAGAGTLRRLRPDWQPAVPPPAVKRRSLPVRHESLEAPEFSWVGETARHIGTVVHRALESFAALPGLPGPEEIERRRAHFAWQLQRAGVPEREVDAASRTVVLALTRALGDERGRWLFDRSHREAHSELALTGVADGRLTNVIIDRTFVDATGTRWVVDFKTSRHEGANLDTFLRNEVERYRPQLARNVGLARGLGPEPVRAALYFPLMGQLVEVI